MDKVRTVLLEKLDERYGTLRLSQPSVEATLRHSLARSGQLQPLVANQEPGGQLALLDGFKRLRVLRSLSQVEAEVRVVCLKKSEALAAVISYNRAHRGLNELEEAWVVRGLVRECRLAQKAVGELLGRHKSWVCRRLMLAEQLNTSVQDEIRLGLVGVSVARELCRLPRGNQERVAEVVRRHGLSYQQSRQLVSRYLESDNSDALENLLTDPLRYISSGPPLPQQPPTGDPRLGREGQQVRRRLVYLERAAVSARQILHTHLPTRLGSTELAVLSELALAAKTRCHEVSPLLTSLLQAAGQTDE